MMRWWTNYGDLIQSLHREFAEVRLNLFHMSNEHRQHRTQTMTAINDLKRAIGELSAAVDAAIAAAKTPDHDIEQATAALIAMRERLGAALTSVPGSEELAA